jgi:hypothetical protein
LLDIGLDGYKQLPEIDQYNLLANLPGPNWGVAVVERERGLFGNIKIPEVSEIFTPQTGYVPTEDQGDLIAAARQRVESRKHDYAAAIGDAQKYSALFEEVVDYAAKLGNTSLEQLANRRRLELAPIVLKSML